MIQNQFATGVHNVHVITDCDMDKTPRCIGMPGCRFCDVASLYVELLAVEAACVCSSHQNIAACRWSACEHLHCCCKTCTALPDGFGHTGNVFGCSLWIDVSIKFCLYIGSPARVGAHEISADLSGNWKMLQTPVRARLSQIRQDGVMARYDEAGPAQWRYLCW